MGVRAVVHVIWGKPERWAERSGDGDGDGSGYGEGIEREERQNETDQTG